MGGIRAKVWNAMHEMGASMNLMASVCMQWIAGDAGHVHRGIAPVILKGKDGRRKMIDLKILNKDIEEAREKVERYEIIAAGFDDDLKRQRDEWLQKSAVANRMLAYLIALRKHILDKESVSEEICNHYCKWPDQWDEETEGCPLAESEHCQNCPLDRL